MGVTAAIGLGSNLGERGRHLESATKQLESLGSIVGTSSWYETAPIGGPEQGPYLNAVVVIDTDVGPRALLEALLEIERGEGRERRVRWGPRSLDLDLLLYGDVVIKESGLTVPHPEITRRRFVLVPLVEAWPGVALPDGTQLDTFLPAVADQQVDRATRHVDSAEFPSWAPAALFLVVGMGSVALWWALGLIL